MVTDTNIYKLSILKVVMEKIPDFRKFIGCMQGLAIGDALGYPVEFMTKDAMKRKYGPMGVYKYEKAHNFPEGTYSDDTQMALAVANGLLKSKNNNVDEIMKNISQEFVDWYKSPNNNRAPGMTCMAGCRQLAAGDDWRYSGVIGSEGCGAAMRSAPIGLAFYNDLNKLKEIATASAISTHNGDVASASSVANAYLVARGIRSEDYHSSLQDLIKFTDGISRKFTEKIKQIPYAMTLKSDDALDLLGEGWTGHEAVASALYCALKNDYDFEKTVLMAANTNGDSDSIASIAGGIVGAYSGISNIPVYYRKHIENKDGLFEVAKQLHIKYCK